MADNRFAAVPNISIPRSRWKQPFNHSTSFNHGEIVPVDCFDILPGDTYKVSLASLIWMSNPIRPIFGNITAHVDVFFVPMRLVWDKTKEFFGENKTSSGYQTGSYKIPSVLLGYSGGTALAVKEDSLSHYLGKPITPNVTPSNTIAVSVLKERAYYEIWNTYYRAEQLQNPILIQYGGNGTYAYTATNFIDTGSTKGMSSPLMHCNKEFDYFTAATLYPQYGPAVTLPLGSYAPVITRNTQIDSTFQPKGLFGVQWWNNGSSGVGLNPVAEETVSPLVAFRDEGLSVNNTGTYDTGLEYGGQDNENLIPANLWTDLSQATSATINQLRYAFAVQKFLERSNFGTRFFEMLSVHYGVTSPDATLQIPQRIGHADFPINISTVLSTAGAADDQSSALGMPGAASCTANSKYLCTHAFTEPGYLFVLLSTTHERSYSQGILREDMKLDRYEIYSPEFANLGDQEIKKSEIFYGDDAYNNDVFGYQEHWAEYRYRPHRVSGILDPASSGALDFWVLTDHYDNRPALDGSWIEEDRDELSRCLVSGENGPDYIGDFYLPYIATREMPLFTIPGLIDHFGVR